MGQQPNTGFAGKKVLALESRRANEIGELIRRQGGDPFLAPSMRELPLESNDEAFRFAENLFAGQYDMLILLTGVGTRALNRVLASRYPEPAFADAIRNITVVARGPKPAMALREMNVPVTVNVPEPNTWRELLVAIEGRPERRIAVQEYGQSNVDLLDALRRRGAEVTPVRVYQWDLPEDTGPLREAAQRLASGEFNVVLFTTSVQALHLLRIAAELGIEPQVRAAMERMMVASIGPTTTETLDELGIGHDMMPSHPKMGFLVKEAAEQVDAVLDRKRA
jgi:uroporphyrinogen-III synthase